jgi:tryptophan synthase beta chain
MAEARSIPLAASELPTSWYNLQADMPHRPPPPLHPGTQQPLQADDLARIFPMNLIEQEMSTERWIGIPEPVLDKLLLCRPTPLRRALDFERALDCPVKIFYKDESVSPPGSHKFNTAVAQAYYNHAFGIKRLATETGAGQWGCSLAAACNFFGLELKVYMVRTSFEQKPFRKLMMQTWGAKCVSSPSQDTQAGRDINARLPGTPGSLGIAISEAVEDALTHEHTRYALGSVLNHVLLHQTVIGLEAQKQLASVGLYPDVVIGCAGGGSNFAGISFPYVRDRIHGKTVRILAAEPAACPTLTRGPYRYDFGDLSGLTPLLAMHTLGHQFMPPSLHAGGLRYHGMAPLVSQLKRDNLIEAEAIPQLECYAAGILWARTEGFIPAPETTHALAAAIREAKRAKAEGRERTILLCYSGHGLFDLAGYDAYLSGQLTNHELPQDEIAAAIAKCPPAPAL